MAYKKITIIFLRELSLTKTMLLCKRERERERERLHSKIESKSSNNTYLNRAFVVTSTQNHRIKHLFNIIEILFLFKIFHIIKSYLEVT